MKLLYRNVFAVTTAVGEIMAMHPREKMTIKHSTTYAPAMLVPKRTSQQYDPQPQLHGILKSMASLYGIR